MEIGPFDLGLDGVRFGYGDITAVWDVTVVARSGRICGLVGRNGAGKSTLCSGIAGLLTPQRGRVILGRKDVSRVSPWKRAQMGIGLVQEGKRVFRDLTVLENLRLAARSARIGKAELEERFSKVYEAFPVLYERRRFVSGALSGGQQQMLVIGQALIGEPSVLIIDEPSSGLAPLILDQILGVVSTLRSAERVIILVDRLDLIEDMADDILAMDSGRVVFDGPQSAVDSSELARQIYLG